MDFSRGSVAVDSVIHLLSEPSDLSLANTASAVTETLGKHGFAIVDVDLQPIGQTGSDCCVF